MQIQIDCNIPIPPKRKPNHKIGYLTDDRFVKVGIELVKTGQLHSANAAAIYLVKTFVVPGISDSQNIRRLGAKIRNALA